VVCGVKAKALIVLQSFDQGVEREANEPDLNHLSSL
jgi:hypothetical protein